MRNNLNELISRVSVWQLTRRSTRGEQPDEGVEVGEKNDQIALRRIVAGRKSSGMRNSNSPETGISLSRRDLPVISALVSIRQIQAGEITIRQPQVTLAIEGHTQHRSQAGYDGLDVSTRCDFQNLRGPVLDRERVEIPDKEITVIGDGSWNNMPLRRGDIRDPVDRAIRRDNVQ